MKWSFLNVPLGLVDPAQNTKQIAPAVAAGLIAGGVSLVNGIGSLWSQADTNRANRQISEDTNEMNYRINQEQIAAARDQYNRERLENRFLVDQAYQRELENRAYNSPAALRQRYLAAGINPYLAMSGSSGGSVSGSIGSSVGSPAKGSLPNSIPVQVGIPKQPLNFEGFGVNPEHMMDFHLAAERQQADIAALKTQTDLAVLETFAKIKNYDFNNKHLRSLSDQIEQDIAWNSKTIDVRSRALELANQKIEADMNYKKSLAEYQRIVNQYEPKRQQQLLANLEAEYDNIYSSVLANNENAALAAANRALVGVEKATKEKMAEAIVDDAYNRANESYWRSEREGRQYLLGDKLGTTTPAIDYISNDGRSYESPNAQFRGYKNKYSKRYVRRKDLDHVGQ